MVVVDADLRRRFPGARGFKTFVVIGGLAVTTGVGRTADVKFYPAVELSVFRDDNVLGVGDGPSDQRSRVVLELGWGVDTPTAKWSLVYAPYRDAYRENTGLDQTGHVLRSSLDKRFSPRSSLNVTLHAARTTDQGISSTRPNVAVSQLPRTTIDSALLGIGGVVRPSSRTAMRWGFEGSGIGFEDGDALGLRDHRTAAAELGLQFVATGGTAGGLAVSSRLIDYYDDLPQARVQTMQMTFSRALNSSAQLELALGASTLDQGDASATEVSYDASAEWRPSALSIFSVGARQSIGPGSGLGGPTLDRSTYVGWSRQPPGRGFIAAVTAAATDRESPIEAPQAPAEPGYYEVSSSLFWRFGRHVRLGVFHSYLDQSSGPTGLLPDTRYHSGGILLRIEAGAPRRVSFTETRAGRVLEERSRERAEDRNGNRTGR